MMKKRYLSHIFSAAFLLATTMGTVSCINDLDISSIDPQSSSSFNKDEVFVKQYATLGLTGQVLIRGTFLEGLTLAIRN